MKRTGILLAAAILLSGGMALSSCSKKDKAADSGSENKTEASGNNSGAQTYEMQEVTPTANGELVSDIEVTRDPNGTLIVNDTLPTETVTPASNNASGYTTTPSGLKYKVIKKGSGAHPKANSIVNVKYTGKLENGKVFDSTDLHGGNPVPLPLNRVIPGWTEGIQLMQPGAVYEFVIPSNLGYGPAGMPPVIPPNATLIFEVELVGIQ